MEIEINKTIDGIVQQIEQEIEADGLDVTDAAVASRIVSYYSIHSDELTQEQKEELLDYGIDLASVAFEEMSGIEAPMSYDEVADFNKYWRSVAMGCKAPKEQVRPVLMTLRDLLNKRENIS